MNEKMLKDAYNKIACTDRLRKSVFPETILTEKKARGRLAKGRIAILSVILAGTTTVFAMGNVNFFFSDYWGGPTDVLSPYIHGAQAFLDLGHYRFAVESSLSLKDAVYIILSVEGLDEEGRAQLKEAKAGEITRIEGSGQEISWREDGGISQIAEIGSLAGKEITSGSDYYFEKLKELEVEDTEESRWYFMCKYAKSLSEEEFPAPEYVAIPIRSGAEEGELRAPVGDFVEERSLDFTDTGSAAAVWKEGALTPVSFRVSGVKNEDWQAGEKEAFQEQTEIALLKKDGSVVTVKTSGADGVYSSWVDDASWLFGENSLEFRCSFYQIFPYEEMKGVRINGIDYSMIEGAEIK